MYVVLLSAGVVGEKNGPKYLLRGGEQGLF